MPAIMQTTMSSPLPQEVFDLIIDFLHDDPDALKACCFVSKSWVHPTQKHLFTHVKFNSESDFKSWQKTFLDPSNSHAHYTRSLSIHLSMSFALGDTGVGDWIRAFSGVVRLRLVVSHSDISLSPLYGLFPTLKSLHMDYGTSGSSSEMFGLVCSFPLLEDLSIVSLHGNYEVGRLDIPSTSPKLTGCLDLRVAKIRPIVRRLLELPSGPHFSKIYLSCFKEDAELITDLVSKCSDTLKSLNIFYYFWGAGFLSAFVVGRYLTATFLRRQGYHAFG